MPRGRNRSQIVGAQNVSSRENELGGDNILPQGTDVAPGHNRGPDAEPVRFADLLRHLPGGIQRLDVFNRNDRVGPLGKRIAGIDILRKERGRAIKRGR